MVKIRNKQYPLVADWNTLNRVFIRPEDEIGRKTLVKYMEQILFGLHDFLNKHVGVTEEISLIKLAEEYTDTKINAHPQKKLADVIKDIINEIAPRAVNVASPYFIGHMTSAIPFFMVHLKAITAALNQNVIKLETSKVLSVLEKQILAKMHRMIFNFDDHFYLEHVQNTETSLGNFTTGGTTANLTALWVARNKCFPSKGNFESIEKNGIFEAMKTHDLEKAVVLVSKRGHYSLRKAGGVLGLGNQNVIPIDVDANRTIDIIKLKSKIKELQANKKTKIVAIIGIAGATETGIIDPLPKLADICQKHGIHFHVDAAWGGPVLLSEKYCHLLKGIERADSVAIDCHKQFYMPMTSGMVYFKDPTAMDHIVYHSSYVNRPGSVDLGIKTLEGSREANSLILDSALKIMGSKGYALMIDHGIETAREFAKMISQRSLFQLVTKPQLNILTYRLVPLDIQKKLETADKEERQKLNYILDDINIKIQRIQREAGKSFVSRTRLKNSPDDYNNNVVLRSVIMNPMTNIDIINEVLDEQESIFHKLVNE
ncbi:pyridoxal-dependent aspartate 1-decarboxylase PanP [Desulfobacula toluolica]|uniref:Pyridoxal-dependent decarboxylase family protein n=1 Tax=Desulfobacula toluolica (strain DSM 7467 / Tol2) TaxID=651182 RepID=K0NEB9_DESTT|nr:putative pyridoxal-dependent aspartate 1-decarboxylase [Desulfobacula toluolica]CCK79225.1 pyridoxal-dependent decarboxylase family protein [Desulfobacula toluolica Tol2]